MMVMWWKLLLLVVIAEAHVLHFDRWAKNDGTVRREVADLLHNLQATAERADDFLWGNKRPIQIKDFSWSSCGSSSDTGHIQDLSVMPDPIIIPGNVSVGFQGSLSADITAPLEVSLEIEKKILFWVTVPCIDDLGSCDYTDVCPMLDQFPCPPEWEKYHITCRCPVKAGSYNVPPTAISVHPFGIPSWLTSGDYKVKATVREGGKQVTCLQLEFTLN